MKKDSECPQCGKPMDSRFTLCYRCNEREKQKPTCEVCGINVPEKHFLCKEHWDERKEEKKNLYQIKYVKSKKKRTYIKSNM